MQNRKEPYNQSGSGLITFRKLSIFLFIFVFDISPSFYAQTIMAKKEPNIYLSEMGGVGQYKISEQLIIADDYENLIKVGTNIKAMEAPSNYAQIIQETGGISNTLIEEKAEEDNQKILVDTIELKNISSDSAREILRDLFRDTGSSNGITKGRVTIKELPEKNALVIMANENDMIIVKESLKSIDVRGKVNNGREVSTKVVFLQNTLVSEVLNTLQQMKGSNSRNRNNRNGESSGLINDDITITSLDNNNSIVLSGTQSEVLRVQGIIQQIDEAPKQVLIEVMILEVSLKNGSVGGVEWNWKKGVPISQEGKTEMGTNFGIRPQYSSGTSNGFVFNFESEYFSAILQSIEDSGEVKIVSAPHILVTNNQKAEIIIGDRVVINKESLEIPTSDNSQPIIRTTRDYVDVGLKLQLTPKIGKNDEVSIDILQEINDIKNSGIPGFPDIAKRSLKTIILVGDQHSAALGGLISKKKTKIQNKVGLLGSLPVIGRLFRKEEVSTQNNELILFITAYVVRSNGDLTKITEGQKKKLQDIRSKILNKK